MGTQRERTRTNGKVDMLPENIIQKLDEMLLRTGQDYMKYQEIADEITAMGYDIGKSTI